MIVVTHEMQFAREAADRVYFMEEGQFIEIGPCTQVIDNPRDDRTRNFLARFLHAAGGGVAHGAAAKAAALDETPVEEAEEPGSAGAGSSE